jgi:hypothetical protein
MKNIFLMVLFSLFAGQLFPQNPVIKSYAFSRNVIAGVRKVTSFNKDNPEEQKPGTFTTSYFLYLEVKKEFKFSVTMIWLKDRYFSVTCQKITAPVLIEGTMSVVNKQRDTLVNKTANDVYEIKPEKEIFPNSKESSAFTHTGSNEVVFFLKSCYKNYCSTVRKIKILEPFAAM